MMTNLFSPPVLPGYGGARPEVLFVGGVDRDRAAFMAEFLRTGPAPMTSGGAMIAALPKDQ